MRGGGDGPPEGYSWELLLREGYDAAARERLAAVGAARTWLESCQGGSAVGGSSGANYEDEARLHLWLLGLYEDEDEQVQVRAREALEPTLRAGMMDAGVLPRIMEYAGGHLRSNHEDERVVRMTLRAIQAAAIRLPNPSLDNVGIPLFEYARALVNASSLTSLDSDEPFLNSVLVGSSRDEVLRTGSVLLRVTDGGILVQMEILVEEFLSQAAMDTCSDSRWQELYSRAVFLLLLCQRGDLHTESRSWWSESLLKLSCALAAYPSAYIERRQQIREVDDKISETQLRWLVACSKIILQILVSMLSAGREARLALSTDTACRLVVRLMALSVRRVRGISPGEACSRAISLLPSEKLAPLHPLARLICWDDCAGPELETRSLPAAWACHGSIVTTTNEVLGIVCSDLGGVGNFINRHILPVVQLLRDTGEPPLPQAAFTLALTGRPLPLQSAYPMRPDVTPSAGVTVASIVCLLKFGKLSSESLGHLLPTVLPLVDYWDGRVCAVGISLLLHLMDCVTPTEVGWHRPLVMESVRRALSSQRDPEVVSLAIAAAAIILALVPRAEIGSMAVDAGSLIQEVIRMASVAPEGALKCVYVRGLAILVETPAVHAEFGMVPLLPQLLALLCPMLRPVALQDWDGKNSKAACMIAVRCIHIVVRVCWPRVPAHCMKLLASLVGLCACLEREDKLRMYALVVASLIASISGKRGLQVLSNIRNSLSRAGPICTEIEEMLAA
jgi:hypothetical protein